MKVDCTIDERDDIFRFFANHPIAANPIREYLSDGWRTLSELMLLLERCGRPLSQLSSILEFASGFGRFTRHLAKAAPGRVTCADVLPGSAEFLRERFGVAAFESARDPDAIRWPSRYELVFVLSLLTHVPLAAWPRWLARLAEAVDRDGLLVFTIHSPDYALEQGVVFDEDGGRFLASSESSTLDAGDYGTTFATWERVRREVAQAVPGARTDIHPHAFWHGQDAVVVRS
jgi:SAM-dependent methyltransferase